MCRLYILFVLTSVKTIIALITPYMVNKDEGNLKSHVFWVWGGFCAFIVVYIYLLVPETKVLPPSPCLLRQWNKIRG